MILLSRATLIAVPPNLLDQWAGQVWLALGHVMRKIGHSLFVWPFCCGRTVAIAWLGLFNFRSAVRFLDASSQLYEH
jgi:hypothetical protein